MLRTVAAFDRIGEENAFAVLARATQLAAQGRDILNLGLGPPRRALLGEKSATATRQRDKDEGADEIPTNSARHAQNFNEFI